MTIEKLAVSSSKFLTTLQYFLILKLNPFTYTIVVLYFQRKLEDVQSMLQRKEREFEATLEHFQSDIESLESEKGELREKLMAASKRTLLEGIARGKF